MGLKETLSQAINSRGVTAEIYYDTGPTVTVKIIGNAGYGAQAGWRVRGRASEGDNTYYLECDQDTTEGSFSAINGKTYMFQAVWGSASNGVAFTVDFDSSSGGDSGGDDGWEEEELYIVTLSEGGYTWNVFPSVTEFHCYQNDTIDLPTPERYNTSTPEGTFVITGNSNGGTANTSITASITKKTSYSFKGWKDSSNNVWFDTYNVLDDVTLTATQSSSSTLQYTNNTLASLSKPKKDDELKTYRVTYNSDGGVTSKLSEDVEATISYNFAYWCSNSSGTGTQYTDSSSFTKATTVYAIWEEEARYPASIILPTATKEGFKFRGWTTKDQAVLLPAETTVEVSKNTEFIAVWESEGRVFIHNGTKWIPVI